MTSFSYSANLPNPPDDPADDVLGMQTNAMSIAGLIAVDHVPFNAPLGGYHNQVSFAINQNGPGIGSGVAELYANNVNSIASDTNSYPFWQNAAAVNVPLFGPSTFSATKGYQTLANGLIFQWALVTITGASTPQPITFPTPFPNNLFSVTTTGISSNDSVNTVNIASASFGKSGFSIYNSATSSVTQMYYIAIGN
jgi:tail fiber protein gp53